MKTKIMCHFLNIKSLKMVDFYDFWKVGNMPIFVTFLNLNGIKIVNYE